MTMTETNDVHPRVAHWIVRSECLYLYEFKHMDFLTINPRTGEIRIIECKFKVGPAVYVVSQLNRYYDALGIASARKLCIAFGTLNMLQKAEFALNNVTPIMFPESMLEAGIKRHRANMPAFDEVFKSFYGGKTINQHMLEYSEGLNKLTTPTLYLTDAQVKQAQDDEAAFWQEKRRQAMQSA
jgi:hypothetical protein